MNLRIILLLLSALAIVVCSVDAAQRAPMKGVDAQFAWFPGASLAGCNAELESFAVALADDVTAKRTDRHLSDAAGAAYLGSSCPSGALLATWDAIQYRTAP